MAAALPTASTSNLKKPTPTQVFRRSLALPSLTPPLRLTLLAASNCDANLRLWSSSHPLPRHLPFLRRLQLKTILALTPKEPAQEVPALAEWAEQTGVRIQWIKVGKWKDQGRNSLSKEMAEEALSAVIDARKLPILMIALAPQMTAALIALLRLLQGHACEAVLRQDAHRQLRLGADGETADEDDCEEVEKWLKGWLGKELSLSVRKADVAEWIWPERTMLRWLRIPDTQMRVTHPTLKVKLLPDSTENDERGARSAEESSHAPKSAANGPALGVNTASTSAVLQQQRRQGHGGRKRSLTISEGRPLDPQSGPNNAANLTAGMAEAAALAAINCSGIDIEGQGAAGQLALNQTKRQSSLHGLGVTIGGRQGEPDSRLRPNIKPRDDADEECRLPRTPTQLSSRLPAPDSVVGSSSVSSSNSQPPAPASVLRRPSLSEKGGEEGSATPRAQSCHRGNSRDQQDQIQYQSSKARVSASTEQPRSTAPSLPATSTLSPVRPVPSTSVQERRREASSPSRKGRASSPLSIRTPVKSSPGEGVGLGGALRSSEKKRRQLMAVDGDQTPTKATALAQRGRERQERLVRMEDQLREEHIGEVMRGGENGRQDGTRTAGSSNSSDQGHFEGKADTSAQEARSQSSVEAAAAAATAKTRASERSSSDDSDGGSVERGREQDEDEDEEEEEEEEDEDEEDEEEREDARRMVERLEALDLA